MLTKAQRAALLVLSLVTFLFSGMTFGWASLVILLRTEGVYEGECRDGGDDGDDGSDDGYLCDSQVMRFGLAYTLAQFCHVFAGLPVGFLLDFLSTPQPRFWIVRRFFGTPRSGVVATASLGLLLLATGSMMLANYGSATGVDAKAGSGLVLPAMLLIGIGGPTLFFPCLRTAEAFKGWESHIISLLNALFDASAVVLAIILLSYRLMGEDSADRRLLFSVLAGLAVLGIPGMIFVGSVLELGGAAADDSQTTDTKGEVESRPRKATPSLRETVLAWPFLGLCIFGSVHVLRSNMYLGSVGDALAGIRKGWDGTPGDGLYQNSGGEGDDEGRASEAAEQNVRVLSFMLPFGVAATPLIGRVINTLGPWRSLVITNWVGLLQGALSVVLPLQAMAVAFVVYVFYRAILYGTLIAAIATLYGYDSLGRLLGILFTFCAVVSLLQYFLVWWSVSVNEGRCVHVSYLLSHVYSEANCSSLATLCFLSSMIKLRVGLCDSHTHSTATFRVSIDRLQAARQWVEAHSERDVFPMGTGTRKLASCIPGSRAWCS